jgi:hypothetical protein
MTTENRYNALGGEAGKCGVGFHENLKKVR